MSSYFVDHYHLLSYDTLDSTNEEAKRLASAGGQPGAVIWAHSQTNGKGRLGREWVSQEGNLYCSILLQPEAPIANMAQLTFVTSLAVHNALQSMLQDDHMLQLKWPNDLLLDGKKLGGILLETFTDPENNDSDPWVVLGVGINIENTPDDVRFPAISLTQAGIEIITAKIVLSRFINSFDELYQGWLEQGFDEIRNAWLKHAAYIGKHVHIDTGTETISGIFKDITALGHIMLQCDGNERMFAAGDVSLRGNDVT